MKYIVKTALILALCMILGAMTVFAAGSGEEADSVDQSDDPQYGAFESGGVYVLVEQDDTFALIDSAKKSCIEGQIVTEGSSCRFVGEGGSTMDEAAVFDGSSWTIGGTEYREAIMFSNFINEEKGDGFVMDEDGMFVAYRDAKNKTGKILGTYDRNGWQWTFSSPGISGGSITGSFDGRDWVVNGERYEWGIISLDWPSLGLRGVYADGDLISMIGRRLKKLSEDGFTVDADLDKTTLKPGELSEEISLTYKVGLGKKGKAEVIAINPFENEATLADCIVCSFYTEDTSKVFTYEVDGGYCGEDLFDKLLRKDVYYYTTTRLIYKTFVLSFGDMEFTFGEDPKGEQILDASGNCDLTFDFDGQKLKSFCFSDPDLLYSGLDDNVDPDTLSGMDPEDVQDAVEERNSILDELKKAMEDAEVKVRVNEQTGEITMDNSILFSTDSYELSEEGRKYLDTFMKVYAQVLLSDKNYEHVAAIRLEGHTDSRSSYGHNKILSERRAESVLVYCLNSKESGLTDLEKDRLKALAVTEGYANADPVYDENGKEDMEASRRVTVKFHIKVK